MRKILLVLIVGLISLAKLSAQESRCDQLNGLFISHDMVVCRLDTLRFDHSNNFSVLWSDNSRKPAFTVRDTGTIWVRHYDSTATCSPNFRQDTIHIAFFPKPEFKSRLQIDTVLCFGDTVKLTMPSVKNAEFYTWNDPTRLDTVIQDSSITIVFDSIKRSNTLYIYKASAIGSCWRRAINLIDYMLNDSAIVFFSWPPQTELGTDTTLCPTEKRQLQALDPAVYLPAKYGIAWDGQASNANVLAIDTAKAGLHWVKIGHRCGDTVSDSVTTLFWPSAWTASALITDTSVCEDVEIRIDATNPFPLTTYFWEDDSSTNPVRDITKALAYTVKLTDSAGCQQSYTCNVANDDCNPLVEFPNVFSPNGDQINDVFFPLKSEKVFSFRFSVYNGLGNRVYFFEGDPKELKWDGTNERKPLPEGVYYFVAKYKDVFSKKFVTKGSVTIFR